MPDMFEIKNLDRLDKTMLKIIRSEFPKEAKKLMVKMANGTLKIARSNTKSSIRKDTGNYLRGWKRGKVYKRGNDYYVRANNNAPHAHLIESGHKIVGHKPNKTETGEYVPGKHILEKSLKQFDGKLPEVLNEFMNKVFRELKL